jgi:class 3 adenylate cyclase
MAGIDLTLTKQHFSTKIYRTYFRYIAQYYPEINVSEICAQAGLPFEYVNSSDNWVSVLFDYKFMSEIRTRINDPDFEFRVGQYAVSKEGLGPVLYSLGRNGFSLEYFMNSLWRFGQYFNKVMSFELLTKERGQIVLKLKPLFIEAGLDDAEIEALKKSLPHIAESTKGHFAGAPLLKDLPPANVKIETTSDLSMILTVDYKYVPENSFQWLLWFGVIGAGHSVLFIYKSAPTIHFIFLAFSALIFSFYRYWHRTGELSNIVRETESNLSKIDEQYQALLTAKTQLQRKLQETSAINGITNSLIQRSSEEEILSSACKELNEKLGFDRSVILLKDTSEKFLEYRAGYFEKSPIEILLKSIKFEIDLPVDDPTKISNVYRFRRPILIEDVSKHIDTLNPESQLLLRASASKSFVCVPIASEDNAYGLLLVDNYKTAKRLSSEDVVLLTTVGRQIAIVLEKQRAQTEAVNALFDLDKLAKSYSRFVPFNLIKILGFETVTDVDLKSGKEVNMAIIFTDIRGFTTMAEGMSPGDSVQFLNSYFSNLAPIFEKHNGIIDKFLGDGIMALFLNVDDAIKAMAEYQIKLGEYNTIHREGGKRKLIRAGMGLHYGKVLLGAIGFENRMSISVVSDSVNLASRLDGLTKKFGIECVCTDVVLRARGENSDSRLIAELKVEGRHSLTKVYELYGHKDSATKSRYKETELLLSRVVSEFNRNNFDAASVWLKEALKLDSDDPVLNYYNSEISEKILNENGQKRVA